VALTPVTGQKPRFPYRIPCSSLLNFCPMTELVQSFRPQNEELAAAFSRYLEARNLSPRTRRVYASAVRRFVAYLGSESIARADSKTIRAFLADRQVGSQSVFVIGYRLSVLRAFYRFLCVADVVRFSPAQFIAAPKLPRKLPQCPSEKEVEKLLAAADNPMERAVLEVLYGSGLRLAEVASVRIENVNLQAGTLRVLSGKGNKDRVALFGSKAADALRSYLGDRKRGLVFLNQRSGELGKHGISKVVRDCARRVGLPWIHPHLLRHAFATHLLDRGADIRYVQQLLGHALVSTTQFYTHLTTKKLFEVHSRCHPHGGETP
jgi:site-specific recombinase XerD